jgi:hypothetical protein
MYGVKSIITGALADGLVKGLGVDEYISCRILEA